MNEAVELLVNGRPVKQYAHKSRLYVEAREGTEYEITVRNSGYSRILAVVSVDGINVVSGEVASENGAGYIVSGLSSYTIKGFRTSNDVVNRFVFSKKLDSYAAKSEETGGNTTNCGVIGVRFFAEYQRPVHTLNNIYHVPYKSPAPWTPRNPTFEEPYWSSAIKKGGSDISKLQAMSMLRSFAPPQDSGDKGFMMTNSTETARSFDMGTEFSKIEVKDKVTTAEFQRGAESFSKDIYYASRGVLESFGVQFQRTPSVTFPSAFPKGKFCKRPN